MPPRDHSSRGLRQRRALIAVGAVLALGIGGGAVARAVSGGGAPLAAGPVSGSARTATPSPSSSTTGLMRTPTASPTSATSTSTATTSGAPRSPASPRTPTPTRSPTPTRTPTPTRSPAPTRTPTPSRTPAATPTTRGTDDAGDGVDTAHLTPTLGRALTAATAAARRDGVRIRVVSGYRTPAHQLQLYEQAIRTYGSARLARRWVLPPSESAHVRGEAVDVGPRSAAVWLQTHGTTWGLCRRYDNEWWHFEVATSPGGRCPARAPHV